MLKAAGPSGYLQVFALERRDRRVGSSEKSRYNCFLTGRKREKPARPERFRTKSLPGPAAVLAEGRRQRFWIPYKNRFSVLKAPEEPGGVGV